MSYAELITESRIRALMIQRDQQIDSVLRTIDAVIHDVDLLRRQLIEEQKEWRKAVELSLQAAEARLRERKL